MSKGKLSVKVIAAMAENRVIGSDNDLPWHLPEDLKRFSSLTSGHAVLMGRKTYESLPEKYRPLPKRINIVATRNVDSVPPHESVRVCDSVRDFILSAKAGGQNLPTAELWVIGGAQVYVESLALADEVFLTRLAKPYDGDVYFPEFEADFSLLESEPRDGFAFERYERNLK